mmetsp:Transcript_3433/g.12338  ORF Transcript_3433/g.12338 Transcript_3433/m.12338 type:complete len:239 (-) Transcript_3433:128-844(-)
MSDAATSARVGRRPCRSTNDSVQGWSACLRRRNLRRSAAKRAAWRWVSSPGGSCSDRGALPASPPLDARLDWSRWTSSWPPRAAMRFRYLSEGFRKASGDAASCSSSAAPSAASSAAAIAAPPAAPLSTPPCRAAKAAASPPLTRSATRVRYLSSSLAVLSLAAAAASRSSLSRSVASRLRRDASARRFCCASVILRRVSKSSGTPFLRLTEPAALTDGPAILALAVRSSISTAVTAA